MVAEVLSPTRCASCERPGALICERCLHEMVRIDPVHACLRCGAPFGDLLCTECGREGEGADASDLNGTKPAAMEDGPDRCLAAAVFEGPPARIVRAYKDGGERRLAGEIAHLMAEAARVSERVAPDRYGGILSSADSVTFVPATAAAFRRRGFDHMEHIARAFTQITGTTYLDALAKRGKLDQRALTREERRAMSRGVYLVVEPDRVRGRRILLLDDVITTGATVRAAAEALKRAGAVRVDALAFARVWG